MKTVVIIGGGPIGLAHAIGIKNLNTELNVIVYEKYEEYQRKHVLNMQHAQLHAFMESAGLTKNATLLELERTLKKDPHIRTNVLETTLKGLALEHGVEIRYEPITPENIQEKIFSNPDVGLILGADGTHSVTSRALFPPENQVKHEFDYVLQLRFEVDGTQKAEDISLLDFFDRMSHTGYVGNEYVGPFDTEKKTTPVTMQMMISKAEFTQLQHATSKDPIFPYQDIQSKIPKNVEQFIDLYITKKIQQGQHIDKSTLRVSVNEAPATHAKQVTTDATNDATNQTAPVVLVGDAGLGLSYFKGLNAGFESSARLLTQLKAAIQDHFQHPHKTQHALTHYQTWFLNDFAPNKVREVSHYSQWRIRSTMKFMGTLENTCGSIQGPSDYNLHPLVADHLRLQPNSDLFPHRPEGLFDPIQLNYVPPSQHVKKLIKIGADYLKPYKSKDQFIQNMKQPWVGFLNLLTGILKLFAAAGLRDRKLAGDGVLSIVRGTIEIVTTPLTWILKPIVRGVITLLKKPVLIEYNAGIQQLARLGQNKLRQANDHPLSNDETYALRAICHDLHRKFEKSLARGQVTKVNDIENKNYNTIGSNPNAEPEVIKDYFSVFTRM